MNTITPDTADLAAGVRIQSSTEVYPGFHRPGDAGLPLVVIENELAHAVIALQGAHVLAFQPKGQPDMLWRSPLCQLVPGKAIRAGIPLCLPWFGPGPDGKSAHGFVRTAQWTLATTELLADGATRLQFELTGDVQTSPLWPHAFRFALEITVGTTLQLRLSAENRSDSPAPYAFAFHTYFAVPDVAKATVRGLEQTTLIDKLDKASRKYQHGEVTLAAATDRIYLDVPVRQTLIGGEAPIVIDSDCHCAVVWNAWDNDRTIADIGAGNHVGYLCVERGEVGERAMTLMPGQTHHAWMTLAFA